MSPSTESRESREFAREIKFLVTPGTAERIGSWAQRRLAPDPNAGGAGIDSYRICSLYFDTEQFDVFHRRGSFGRSKYRIRRYGDSDRVFLERKLKTRGLLSKRRSVIETGDVARLGNGGAGKEWAGQWFHRRLQARQLRPVCQISYQRFARVALTQYGPIRLTLDRDIEAVAADVMGFSELAAGTAFLKEHVILELKYLFDLPALFKELIEEFSLNAQPVSKYRLATVALGLVPSAPSRHASFSDLTVSSNDGESVAGGENFLAALAF